MEPELARARRHRGSLKGHAVPTPAFPSEKPRRRIPGEKLPNPQTQRGAGEKPLLCAGTPGLALENNLGTALWDWVGRGVAVPAAEIPKGEDLGINTLGQEKAGWFGGF